MQHRVLVVDDEPFIVRSLSYVLEQAGFDVRVARDGDTAVAAARAAAPHVCLLDAMMPGRSGFDVCREIKADPELRGMHVIMLTAKGQRSARDQGFRAGCDEYLTKPFSPSEIVLKVRAACAARARPREGAPLSAPSRPSCRSPRCRGSPWSSACPARSS